MQYVLGEQHRGPAGGPIDRLITGLIDGHWGLDLAAGARGNRGSPGRRFGQEYRLGNLAGEAGPPGGSKAGLNKNPHSWQRRMSLSRGFCLARTKRRIELQRRQRTRVSPPIKRGRSAIQPGPSLPYQARDWQSEVSTGGVSVFTAVGYVYHRERGDYFNAKNAKGRKIFRVSNPNKKTLRPLRSLR